MSWWKFGQDRFVNAGGEIGSGVLAAIRMLFRDLRTEIGIYCKTRIENYKNRRQCGRK